MNYSKNLRRKAMAKRIIASWVVVAVVFSLVGGVSGYSLKTHIINKDKKNKETQTNEQMQSGTVVYGAYDDRIFTEEISLDWGAGDLDFTPLDCKMPKDQQEFLFYLCTGYNIDFSLVMALIEHESDYRADAISNSNDYGLMQINKINHKWIEETIGVTDYLDPYQNMRAGCFILRKLFEKYQDTETVLMAYNMGETGASRLWKKGVFSTDFTESVLNIQHRFNKQSGGES